MLWGGSSTIVCEWCGRAGGVGISEVEWVVVGVGVVVGNEGRNVGVVVYIEDGDGFV